MTISSLDLQQFIATIRNNSPYDFSEYSDKSLKRRLAKLLIDYKLDIPNLILQMRNDSQFVEQVVKRLTVNTTELFRDPHIWQYLKYVVLPKFKKVST